MFTDCLNLFDISERFSNTKKPTINLLLEHQYLSDYKLGIREILLKNLQKNSVNKQAKRSENSIRKTIHTEVNYTGVFYMLFESEFTV